MGKAGRTGIVWPGEEKTEAVFSRKLHGPAWSTGTGLDVTA